MGWGSFFTMLAGVAVTAVTTVMQVRDAKADAKKVNSQIDELNSLNAQRRELERSDKEAGLQASQRARLASIRNTMGARGIDTEGNRSKNIETVTESSLTGRLDILNKSADLGNKVDKTTSTIQKLQNKGPSTASAVTGVAGSLLGGALTDFGASGGSISDLYKSDDNYDINTEVDSFKSIS
tara:strand:+ start:65 stop:610 length:546 start_codon:yes stop_codon:yes gene_type:complete